MSQNASLAKFVGYLCQTLAATLPKVDPAQLTKDELDALCCDVHTANTAIDLFRIHASQLRQTPTQEP